MNLAEQKKRIQRMALVKYLIDAAGLTGADIEKQFELYAGQVSETIRLPNTDGEKAIAAALGKPAHELFPDRYDTSGHRLMPQPSENYWRITKATSRRKQTGVRT